MSTTHLRTADDLITIPEACRIVRRSGESPMLFGGEHQPEASEIVPWFALSVADLFWRMVYALPPFSSRHTNGLFPGDSSLLT